jgi:hypothetical protein
MNIECECESPTQTFENGNFVVDDPFSDIFKLFVIAAEEIECIVPGGDNEHKCENIDDYRPLSSRVKNSVRVVYALFEVSCN